MLNITRVAIRDVVRNEKLVRGDKILVNVSYQLALESVLQTMTVDKIVENPKNPIIIATGHSDGNIYVINFNDNRVAVYTDSNAYVSQFNGYITKSSAIVHFDREENQFQYSKKAVNQKHNVPLLVGDIINKKDDGTWKVLAIGSDGAVFIEQCRDPGVEGSPKSVVLRGQDDTLIRKFPELEVIR